MRIFSSRKAELQEYTIGLIVKVLFTMTVIISTWMIVYQGFTSTEFSKTLDAETIMPLIMYNPEIMVVEDINKQSKLYPGWIDMWKLNHLDFYTKFDDSMKVYSDLNYFSMHITLYDSTTDNIEKDFYYKMEDHVKNKVMIDSGLTRGTGGYSNFTKVYPVYYGEGKKSGFLEVEAIFPNS